jgi:hypothetical protein
MISRQIPKEADHDNYRKLAGYIADAGKRGRGEGEKVLMSWCAGCAGGDDYAEGIAEAEDVQSLNARTQAEKTYHLVISFRPEDEAKLTPEIFREIEREFALALGFEEHQRHCGVHKNTGNIHMHIAYNMIHPEKLTHHDPYGDRRLRNRVCRELEKRYGLTCDQGRTEKDRQPLKIPRIHEKAAAMEAHTGEQSFQSYAGEHKEALLRALEAAETWQALHEAFARYGMEIKTRGAGLVVKDRYGKHAMKASELDRGFSLKKLEARFGAYAPAQNPDAVIAKTQGMPNVHTQPGGPQGAQRWKILPPPA